MAPTARRAATLFAMVMTLLGPVLVAPAGADAAFGFLPGTEGFEMVARDSGGTPATESGSHPVAVTAHIGLEDGGLGSLRLQSPPGLLQNPRVVTRCSASLFNTPRSSPFEASVSGEDCPDASQVGTVEVHSGLGGPRRFGLFSLLPETGFSAELGFAPFGNQIAFALQLRPGSDGQYAFALEAAEFPPALDVQALDITLWGIPWSAAHDGERGDCLNEAEPAFPWAKCSTGPPFQKSPLPYLTMPADCSRPLGFTATATSWQQPTAAVTRSYTREEKGQPVRPTDCSTLTFHPFAFGQLNDPKASSASGFVFSLRDEVGGLTEADGRDRSRTRRAVVSLPEGVTVNPSMGAGLGVCTRAQYSAEATFPSEGSGCPNAAKIGSLNVSTPLFEEPLEGGVYLAEPDNRSTSAPGAENPFDSMLAIYLIGRSTPRGTLIKVAGKIEADPGSGRLTAIFDDLPQLPYTELEVLLRTGQRAPLITPPKCGPAVTGTELIPWAAGVAGVSLPIDSPIKFGIGGGSCPTGAVPAFTPAIKAGSINSNVGSYTPFYLHLTRGDAEQEITSYSAILPRGITGRLAGIPFCSEAAIAVARGRTGVEETAHPSCPAASQVGRTYSGYGIGSALAYAPGRIFLAGPYHGSPLSLVTINAATVGPFDLGTIVIRSAFEVDPRTAQLRIDSRGSDPIPHIIDGIPLHLRDIRVYIDRPEFARNPTSCEPSQVVSTLTGSGGRFGDPTDDSSATASSYFQLLNCRNLGFRPRLGIRLRGGSRRGAYPSLRAVFAARLGDANLNRIAVTMPHSEFLAQNHIRSICTQQQFAAEKCPPKSIYGRAVAYTPLFDQPLRGPIYLRASSHRLPDLVASLHSGAVHIVLEGRIGPARDGIRTFFTDLPDAEITRFVMQMYGGKRGLLVNSANICASPPSATVKALAQNNVGAVFKTELRGQCAKKRGRGKR